VLLWIYDLFVGMWDVSCGWDWGGDGFFGGFDW